MKLSELRSALEQSDELVFVNTDGNQIPAHFHITEMGLSTKHSTFWHS